MKTIAVAILCLSVQLALAEESNGLALFEEHCGKCHAATTLDSRAPNRESLRERTPESILNAITLGPMAQQGRALTVEQRRQVAEYIAGRPLGTSPSIEVPDQPNGCPVHSVAAFGDPLNGPAWNGWGADLRNSRFQPAAAAGLTADQVPRLKLKWAFGFLNASSMYGQPSVAGGRVYIGADNGFVYSLDAKTGCAYWSFHADGGVRTALSIGLVRNRYVVYFGDVKANVYALDAKTGRLIWRQHTDPHPIARVTGAPALVEGVLYVPVASLEELQGGNPEYECCTFRGSIIAYDAQTGNQIWKTYTIPQEPQRTKRTLHGTQLWGPAGAAIWSAPTIDSKRGLLYAATGDAYTAPAAPTSDAVMAFDRKTGKVIWVKQLTENDAFVCGDCGDKPSRSETCPPNLGPDFDFGNSPILQTLPNGHDILVIGQKSGNGWALDPEKQGAVIWQHRVGKGSTLGGMEWGSATDGRLVYFPNADASWGPEQAGGLAAVKIESGERVWFTRPPLIPCQGNGCVQAQAAAVTVIPDVVFSGSSNGIMRAYSTADGKIIWQYDTARKYSTVNGLAAKGGGINGPGPVIVGGMLFMGSGYAELGSGTPGNVLLAFGIE